MTKLARLLPLLLIAAPCFGQSDTFAVYEVDNTSQTNRPVTLGRVFVDGEIANCPQPTISGTGVSTYQADVKDRYADGSVKLAIVSFLLPSLSAAGNQVIGFKNNASCNNTGYITNATSPSFATFNGGNWDAQILVAAAGSTTVTTSAKTMLGSTLPSAPGQFGDCGINYWLQGPVVTAIIVQDCTATMSADFGWTWNASTMSSPATGNASTASFHPMFILYFYPSLNAVECEEIIENDWTGKAQDQLADFTFKTEDSGGTLHTRWTRTGARTFGGVTATVTNNLLPVVSTAQLVASGAGFSSTDVGLNVCITDTSYNNPFCGTIQSVTNSTTAIMALATEDGSWGGGSSLVAYMDLVSAFTRSRKTFWSGTAPGHIRIDYNFPYLIATGAFPNYDMVNASINPHNGYYPTTGTTKCCDYGYDGWIGTDRGDIGGFSGIIADYSGALEGAPLQRSDLALLYNMSTCGASNGYCAVALQQETGVSALGDLSTHAGLDTSTVTQYDVSGGGGMWDVFGGVPFHARESRTTATRNGFNGINTGNAFPCYYVSQFENKNANYSTTLAPTSFASCLGGGDTNVTDPTGPNGSVGRAISIHAHSDAGVSCTGIGGPSPVGSVTSAPHGWGVCDEGQYHWLDYAYTAYMLTGSPYYLQNEFDSAAWQPNFSAGFNGIYGLYTGHYILRWLPWGMQSAARAAFIAPDGSADQAYWLSQVNSNIEFTEGSLGATGTNLTPSTSQGSFATSGTITNFNVDAANRWDLGRYNEMTGNACVTTGSGSCTIIPSGLRQFEFGFCNNTTQSGPFPNMNGSTVAAVNQFWMYWYSVVVFGELRDMGFTQATVSDQQMGQFLEGMTLSPTGNPWYALASYETPIQTGGTSACPSPNFSGSNLPFYTRYGGSTGIYGGWNSAYGNPTSLTRQGNFSGTPPSGGILLGNFPCTDHSYSLVARAGGTYLPAYGVNETDADGTYTPAAASAWLLANIPYWGNAAATALTTDCPQQENNASGNVGSYGVMIKWSLLPRNATVVVPPIPPPAQIIGLNIKPAPTTSTVTLSPSDANGKTSGTSFSLPTGANESYTLSVTAPATAQPVAFPYSVKVPVPSQVITLPETNIQITVPASSVTHSGTCTPTCGTTCTWVCSQ